MSARSGSAWRWVPVLLWMALIFALSAQAGLRVSDDVSVDGPIRHVVHIIVFGILAGLIAYALRARSTGTPRLLWLAVLLTTAYGVTDEIHQSFVPDRSGNGFDVLLDATGALIAVAIIHWWPRYLEWRRLRAG